MSSHPFPLIITTIVLLFVYQGIFTSLTMAFGIPGFHQKGEFFEKREVKVEPL
jgi:hypothetical protein